MVISTEKLNEKYLRWCDNTDSQKDDKESVRKYLEFFMKKHNLFSCHKVGNDFHFTTITKNDVQQLKNDIEASRNISAQQKIIGVPPKKNLLARFIQKIKNLFNAKGQA